MRIINLPIEPLEERYTEQWFRWYHEAFSELKINFVTIQGQKLTDKIETGDVLDCYGTHFWKFTQIINVIQLIKKGFITDDDILFFHDLWFPGIESLQYIRNITGKKFKITGVLHAGTWDDKDFTVRHGMSDWAHWIEMGWLEMVDEVFLGSQYHKDLITDFIIESYGDQNDKMGTEAMYQDHFAKVSKLVSKLKVTGLPFKASEVDMTLGVKKENIVVFPHRLDPEKRPDLFDEMVKECGLKSWRYLKTKEECKTKQEYYDLLARAKYAYSFAEQETFGYAMLEAIANKCIPMVPNRLSYATMDIYKGFREGDKKRGEAELPSLEEYEPANVVRKMFLQ